MPASIGWDCPSCDGRPYPGDRPTAAWPEQPYGIGDTQHLLSHCVASIK